MEWDCSRLTMIFKKKSQEEKKHCKQDEYMCIRLCVNICYEQCSRLTHIIKNYSTGLQLQNLHRSAVIIYFLCCDSAQESSDRLQMSFVLYYAEQKETLCPHLFHYESINRFLHIYKSFNVKVILIISDYYNMLVSQG